MADLLLLSSFLILTFALSTLLWRLAYRGSKESPSLVQRVVPIALGAFLSVSLWGAIRDGLVEESRWICTVCGRAQLQTTVFGLPLWAESIKPPLILLRHASTFPEWFDAQVGIQHEHSWRRAQSQILSAGLCAALFGTFGDLYFGALPLLPDQELAVAMATRVANASDVERTRLLELFGRRSRVRADGSTCGELVSGPWIPFANRTEGRTSISAADFHAKFAEWLDCYPEWRE